jgi:hypothetical protein
MTPAFTYDEKDFCGRKAWMFKNRRRRKGGMSYKGREMTN